MQNLSKIVYMCQGFYMGIFRKQDRGGYRTPVTSKMELFVTIAIDWKPFTLCRVWTNFPFSSSSIVALSRNRI